MKADAYVWPPPARAATALPAEATLEQIQAHTEEMQARIDASTKRMLRTANEASETGTATLGTLHQQSETLARVRVDQQAIDEDLSTSDTLLRGLESWRGAAANALSSWWYGEEPVASAEAGLPSAARTSDSRPAAATAATASSALAATARPTAAATDGGLSELSGVVSGLCAQAHAMNAEIHTQSATLDAAITSAEAHSAKLARNTQRARALGGR